MKNEEYRFFEDRSFPITVNAGRVSGIDRVEDARRALHEAIEIKYFYEGVSTLLIGGQTVVARAGDVIVINPYELHATVDTGAEKGKYHLFMIAPELLSGACHDLSDVREALLSGKLSFQTLFREDVRMREILSRAVLEMEERAPYYQAAVKGLMMELFSLLLRYGCAERDTQDVGSALRYYGSVEPALRLIRDRYAERCTLEMLAEECMVSKYHFCRIFKLAMGMSAMQYLNEYRLKLARAMLENTERSVSDIAHGCGFETESYFCRCYKAHFGETPRRRRREHV